MNSDHWWQTVRDEAGAKGVTSVSALVHGDAVKTMRGMPTMSVDLVFADPPYHLSNGGTTNRGGKRVAVDKGTWDASRGLELDHEFHVAWLAEVRRILRPDGALWVSGTHHAIPSIGFAMQRMGYRVLNHVTWHKPNPPQLLSCRAFTYSSESLIWASPGTHSSSARGRYHFDYKAARRLNGGPPMHDVWEIPATGPAERKHGKHPTQKPEALLERVLLTTTEPYDIVFDPFCGSGTTGVVAARHGRMFIGCDMSKAYLDLASRRLRAV